MPVNYTIGLKQYENFDYQLQIANMSAAPERFGYTYGGSTLDRTRLRVLGGKNQITIQNGTTPASVSTVSGEATALPLKRKRSINNFSMK